MANERLRDCTMQKLQLQLHGMQHYYSSMKKHSIVSFAAVVVDDSDEVD